MTYMYYAKNVRDTGSGSAVHFEVNIMITTWRMIRIITLLLLSKTKKGNNSPTLLFKSYMVFALEKTSNHSSVILLKLEEAVLDTGVLLTLWCLTL